MKFRSGTAGLPGAFDAQDIADTIRSALASAGLETRAGPMKQVTDTIEQALSAAGLMKPRASPRGEGTIIESTAREIDATGELRAPDVAADQAGVRPSEGPVAAPGQFVERSFADSAGKRAFKLYVPASYSAEAGEPLPMIVMLHGCTQSPDDFAAGTRMNALADEHGFVVVYPEQCARANAQRCWNWFRGGDQARGSGEPSLIAGITREVAATHRIDPRRIFVAGMSAGAAMAVILGATYPDLYAAVGAHSGLAYGVAHDVPSAFGAMQGARGVRQSADGTIAVPVIVFHGDGDNTVAARNATTIVEQAIGRHDRAALRVSTSAGAAPDGRSYSRVHYSDAADQILAEHWTLHGAGHAWSGGSAAGSYTDARGPDASREMVRFFLSLPRAGSA